MGNVHRAPWAEQCYVSSRGLFESVVGGNVGVLVKGLIFGMIWRIIMWRAVRKFERPLRY